MHLAGLGDCVAVRTNTNRSRDVGLTAMSTDAPARDKSQKVALIVWPVRVLRRAPVLATAQSPDAVPKSMLTAAFAGMCCA